MQKHMKKSSIIETPPSPFKKGGPPVKGPGIKRDGENPSEPRESTAKGALRALKVIINHPAMDRAMAELGYHTK
jgi:hypothetical protein